MKYKSWRQERARLEAWQVNAAGGWLRLRAAACSTCRRRSGGRATETGSIFRALIGNIFPIVLP